MIKFNLQLHKGGGSSSTTVNNSYQMSPEERQVLARQLDILNEYYPNIIRLNDAAAGLLFDSLGTVQQDFGALNNQALQDIGNAQDIIAGLQNGQIPPEYQEAMANSLKNGTNQVVGNLINNLGQKGVINSSVTNKGLDTISQNVANAMADQYQNNISNLSQLAQQQIDASTAPITTTAASQEAAQTPATNLWNASLGLNSANTNTLSSIAGRLGTTTQKTTQNTSGGGLGSGLLGLATGIGSSSGFWNMLGGK